MNSYFRFKRLGEEIENLVCTQVLAGTLSIDFSEKGNETQLIYSGSVLLDLRPLS